MVPSRLSSAARRGSWVALLVGAVQGLVIAVGWYAMYQTTHEQVAEGVERIIVQNNEHMARSVVDAVGGLDDDLTIGSATWERVQGIIEKVELGKGGFACVVDARGFIVCHPQMRSNPGLAEIDLSEHAFAVRGSGIEVPLSDLPQAGVASGEMDFLFDGRHYVASQALAGDGTRLLVHQPVSGLTAASTHLTRGLVAQAVTMGVIVVGLTILIVFLITRAHNAAVLRWNRELDDKVAERTAQLQDALVEAQAAARAKADFLANMSHEIRTPLNGVLGMLEVLDGTELDAEQRQMVATVRGSGTGLLTVLGDVLEYASGGEGTPPERQPLDVRELLSECRELVLPEATRKALPITYLVDVDVPSRVSGDPGRLRQVLANLMANAVKFTEHGRVEVHVAPAQPDEGETLAHGDERVLRFEVSDTGVGIDAARHEAIFEEFEQADGSSTRAFGGMGLGLAVARVHARAMGGRLSLEQSAPGAGSTFALLVPVGACEAPTCEPEAAQGPAAAPAERGTEVAPDPVGPPAAAATTDDAAPDREPRPPRGDGPPVVLVVEDNFLNQRVAVAFLERMGCLVRVAWDGEEAVDAVQIRHYDLVLMDCQMPVMDGLEATRRIRALPGPVGRVPIVALTAHALPGDKELGLAAGMDDYLVKPIAYEALQETVDRWAVQAPA